MTKKLLLVGAAAMLLNGCAYVEEKGWWPIVTAEAEPVQAAEPQSEDALRTAVVLDQLFVGGFVLQGEAVTAVIPTAPRQAIDGDLQLRKADYARVEVELKGTADQTVVAAYTYWKSERVEVLPIGRNDIEQAQNMLASLGYYNGPIDGLYGPRTEQAAKAFERDRGLPVNGRVTDALLQALAVDL